ncbi:hypothetical protein BpHYR1_017048 [Brachionus plicatilis]|uniref:Uncharacterized protein n=1 Tax=Brachionus plicatilis TaxID=10195 RepID=A0A3M7SR68_BRAPC|nr:hypothetical protein BpHYR1_017048 [Brachionus plicatilis]
MLFKKNTTIYTNYKKYKNNNIKNYKSSSLRNREICNCRIIQILVISPMDKLKHIIIYEKGVSGSIEALTLTC